MKADWKTVKASDFISFNPRLSIKKNMEATKIAMDKLQPFTKSVLSTEKAIFSGGSKFCNGDTIMARITPCLENGKTAFIDVLKDDEIGFGSTEFIVLRAIPEVSDPQFVYYLATSPEFRNVAIKSMVGSSGRQRVQQSVLDNLELNVPPLEEQREIGTFLAMIDEKIRINETVNDNLQKQAQALFENTISSSDSISYTNIGEIADVKGGKRLPKGINLIKKANSHPYIRVRDLNNVVYASLSNDYEYVDNDTQKAISRYIVNENDVLISIVGTIGLTAIVDKTLSGANLTENCVKLTNLRDFVTPEYLLSFLRSTDGQNYITKGTVGAVQAKLPIKNIQVIEMPIVDSISMSMLCDNLRSIYSQISTNIIESKILANLRDTLLPKLMSGEIDVSDIQF